MYSSTAAEKCRAWVDNATDARGARIECGWLGRVEVRAGPVFYIPEVHFLRQTGSGGSYNASAAAVAEFYTEFITKGGDPQTVTHFGHSHADMQAFQSGTDRGNVVDRFAEKGLCVAVTWNGRRELYGEVTIFKPVRLAGLKAEGKPEVITFEHPDGGGQIGVRFPSVPVEVDWPTTQATLDAVEEMKGKFEVAKVAGFEGYGFPMWTHDDDNWSLVDVETGSVVTTARTKKEAKGIARDMEGRLKVTKATNVGGTAPFETARLAREPEKLTDAELDGCLSAYIGRRVETQVQKTDEKGTFYFKAVPDDGRPRLFLKWMAPDGVQEVEQTKLTENKRLALRLFRDDARMVDPNKQVVEKARLRPTPCGYGWCLLTFEHTHGPSSPRLGGGVS